MDARMDAGVKPDTGVRRIFVEKRKGFDIEADGLLRDLKINLGISGLKALRIINRYDVSGISDEEYEGARNVIFSEPPVDIVHDEEIVFDEGERVFAVEYLPGQYDQRADSASQCIQMLTLGEKPQCRTARLIAMSGVSDNDFEKIKNYCINPVESREALMDKPMTLDIAADIPEDVRILDGFTGMRDDGLAAMVREMGLAMSREDLAFCRDYFRIEEHRDPTITEIRLLDTYWSDHCRHTTFLTQIEKVEFEEGPYSGLLESVYRSYLDSRAFVHEDREKDICLMDLATIAMKELRKKGKLDDLDASDEINACSIVVNADIDGRDEEWLVMFKNETHNHPTEIEPFGGAATCLGGAIRDPLSGRSYVYQAMRVTGSGDPRTKVKNTIPGKLPQRKITTGAAAGYSSYGNQIGLATGQVSEIYDEGYVAKRMEIGSVIGAAPKSSVVREKPRSGDVVILLGGRTGRDGCGGATGSSKEHDEESLLTCGAEVQKGNPPTERKIQRLFRDPEVSGMIKRCNDFGAGGVSVAIGELADGLLINLDAVPKKYEGLDGTELAISESQERMAVVVSKENERPFIAKAGWENLEATTVAVVTGEGRLRMSWRGRTIVDRTGHSLNTNGAKQQTEVTVAAQQREEKGFFDKIPEELNKIANETSEEISLKEILSCRFAPQKGMVINLKDLENAWLCNLQRLDVCSQKGLAERFDSTIGAGTVLMPFGGKHQLSPSEGMAAKLPLLSGDTATGTLMTYGYNPALARWSPFHGAVYALTEAAAKIAAMGGDYKKIRFTLQEYFEKPGKDAAKWGKPFSALLGAYFTQLKLDLPAIGGKDSMSGTFKDMSVPPTLVAFAVAPVDVNRVISAEFKEAGSQVVLLKVIRDENELPDFVQLDRNFRKISESASKGAIKAAHSVGTGGIARAASMMSFGNKIGMEIFTEESGKGISNGMELFSPDYGSIIVEVDGGQSAEDLFSGLDYKVLGRTVKEEVIRINGVEISLDKAIEKWMEPLEGIFPTKTGDNRDKPENYSYICKKDAGFVYTGKLHIARPRVFIPVFPGTNCEYDSCRAFERAGGKGLRNGGQKPDPLGY